MILLRKKNPKDIQIGFIAINKNGETGGFCLQKGFGYALYDKDGNRMIDAQSLI